MHRFASHRGILSRPALVTAAPAVFTYKGSETNASATNVSTFTTIDIGTAAADRVIIVAVTVQTAAAITSVAIGATNLTSDVDSTDGTSREAIFSGLITAGSGVTNIVLTTVGGAFVERDISVWTATGLTSNTVKHVGNNTTGDNFTINVTAGDFLVAGFCDFSTTTFSTSTAAPTGTRVTGSFSSTAEWNPIAATNASFTVTHGGLSTRVGAGASYR